ncbi:MULTISPECIES: hypothetical protein [unclassified Ensifer]|uniref:hypothetical protein n=1 Tax=unclassified Ensifer TaxID=2633371 RepID=UPI000813CC96|nr:MULTISPECIES: hypothetical protein [unclassified Ensifer]OCP22433.1 hypothetical protein BC361_24580 [Ensifer sp. LC54]OCP22644.1 hypothetical protein BC363_26715 [Ensifer sp. LC384]
MGIRIIPLAAGRFTETRLPATYILGNVVDNTNVCRIIAYVQQSAEIDANGRYNLLQVVLQVSEYAFDDTASWIQGLTAKLKPSLAEGPNNERTLALLSQIQLELGNRTLGKGDRLEVLSPSRFAYCEKVLGTVAGPNQSSISFPDTAAALTVDRIRDLMFTPDRRDFAAHIAKLYGTTEDKAAVVSALTGAIIPPGADDVRRYRVNLYIALTISKLPSEAITAPRDVAALQRLSFAPEMRDPTFADNVSRALAQQGIE